MTIYNATTKRSLFINFREVAPSAATENMFKGDSELSVLGNLVSGFEKRLCAHLCGAYVQLFGCYAICLFLT